MESPRRVVVGLALVVGVVLVAVGLGLPAAVVAQEEDGPADGNVSFGAQVSTFMQSTAADANHTVDRGLWVQAVEDAVDPSAPIANRADRLQERLDALERRSATLAPEDGGPPPTELVYTARASAIRVELANVRQSIDEAVGVAERNGVDDTRLAELRDRAGSMSGPAVAAAARNLTDAGPPEWTGGQGPDREPGPPDDRPDGDQGNENAGGPDDSDPPSESGDGGLPDETSGDGQGARSN